MATSNAGYAAVTENTWNLAARVSRRNDVFGSSIWTELIELIRLHDDTVYFGDGSPEKSLIPMERLRQASYQAWEEAPACLSYGDQQGYLPLREDIAAHMTTLGVATDASRVLVTSGSTQGLDLACRVFLDPGDVVITEDPTFLGATEIFRAYGARVVPVAMDEDGMRLDSLEAALLNEPGAKLIYTIPTFQNPTGTTMPIERRHELIDLARRFNVAILEDDPYSTLRYSGEPVLPLAALDDQVIYLGTFSKTIAPGFRTGWSVASPEITALMLANREVADISNDRLTMRVIYHAQHDFLYDYVETTLDTYRLRRDTMLAALAEHMPEGVTWSRPDGGFFIWITLPETFDAKSLAHQAAAEGVVYFPGQWFHPNEDRNNTIRLSFSTVPEDRIQLGIRRLAGTIRQAITSQASQNDELAR